MQLSNLDLNNCTIGLLSHLIGRLLSASPGSWLLIEWVLSTICRAPSMLALPMLVSLSRIATCHICILLLDLLRDVLSRSVFVSELRHFEFLRLVETICDF